MAHRGLEILLALGWVPAIRFYLTNKLMHPPNTFVLGRSFLAYRMDIVICGAISILGIFAAIRNGNPSPLLLILIMWVANVLFRIGDYRYRVYWRDGTVVCNTANNRVITIRATDIARIEFERSGANTLFRMERPSLRIAIVIATLCDRGHTPPHGFDP